LHFVVVDENGQIRLILTKQSVERLFRWHNLVTLNPILAGMVVGWFTCKIILDSH